MGQDMNIGIPVKANFIKHVEVENLTGVITEIKEATGVLEGATEELKKIRTGTGLILGTEIEEAE